MAHVLNAKTSFYAAAAHGLGSALKSVGTFFERVMNANSRFEKIERMQRLTDVELATQYGINRDQIVAYVFRDKIF